MSVANRLAIMLCVFALSAVYAILSTIVGSEVATSAGVFYIAIVVTLVAVERIKR